MIAREFQIVMGLKPPIDMDLPVKELEAEIQRSLKLIILDDDMFTIPVRKDARKYFGVKLLSNDHYAINDKGMPITEPTYNFTDDKEEETIPDNTTIPDEEEYIDEVIEEPIEEDDQEQDPDLIPDKRFASGYKGNKKPKPKIEPLSAVTVKEIPSSKGGTRLQRFLLGRRIDEQNREQHSIGGRQGGESLPFSNDPGPIQETTDRQYRDDNAPNAGNPFDRDYKD